MTDTPAPGALENASWPRRIAAIFIDWFASYAIVIILLGGFERIAGSPAANLWISVLFVLEMAVFSALLGGSFGQLVMQLRVVTVPGGRRLDLLRALLRSVLIALVIPPLVFRPDGRGLHDMIVGSRVVRL